MGVGTPGQAIRSRLDRAGSAYLDVVGGPRCFPLWLSQLVSACGDTLHDMALVYQLTGRGRVDEIGRGMALRARR